MIACGLSMHHVSLIRTATLVAVLLAVSVGGQPKDDVPGEIIGRIRAVPIAQRIKYTVNADVRPIPFVWIGRDDIGTGQFTTRRSANGTAAYEFLIGSDPSRAPQKTNRWGYLAEGLRPGGGSMVALLKQSNEQSLGDVDKAVQNAEAQRRFPFRVYA